MFTGLVTTTLLLLVPSSFCLLGLNKGLNIGICPKTYFKCPCGEPNADKTIDIPIQQCTFILSSKGSCQPCRGLTPGQVCAKYENCKECNVAMDHCITCPPNKFGLWCTQSCNCQNGGTCHQTDGHCNCLPQFTGKYCEILKECILPQYERPLHIEFTKNRLEARLMCEQGFELVGKSLVRCMGDGRWSDELPKCVRTCDKLPPLLHGSSVHQNSSLENTVGSIVMFTCEPTFYLIGPKEIKCLPSGHWDPNMPSCQQIIFCEDPGLVTNAERIVETSMQQDYSPFTRGTTVRYSCVEDYILIGNPLVICQYDNKWSSLLPRCLKVSDQVVTCESQGRHLVEDVGVPIQLLCPPNCAKHKAQVYGTVIYTELSSVCKAAIHSGKITSEGGMVYLVNNGHFADFYGSDLNGINSKSVIAPGGSFRLDHPTVLNQKLTEGCPEGWTALENTCVLISEKPRVWARALDICYNLASSLPIIDDEDISIGLSELLKERGINRTWLGLKKDPDTLRFSWNNINGKVRPLSAEIELENNHQNSTEYDNEDDCVVLSVANNTWDKENCNETCPFTCMFKPEENLKIKCPDPERIADGELTSMNEDKDGFHAGSSIIYECNALHYMTGESILKCSSNGTWSGPVPSCNKIPICEAPSVPANGYVEILPPAPSNSARRGVIILPKGHSSNLLPAPLSLTPEAQNSDYRFLNITLPPGYYHIGMRASVTCQSRYYQLVGSQTRRCLPNGEWSGRTPTCLPICGRSDSPRSPFIVNGTASLIGQWPWQVGIARHIPDYKLWFLLCGGALLNENWVITAAHCVTYSASVSVIPVSSFRIYLGKHNRSDDNDDDLVQVRSVKEIHVHPDYDPAQFDADIALIELSNPAVLTSRVQPVCLPSPLTTRDNIVDGKKGVATGWGLNENKTYSEVLQQVTLPVVSHVRCEEGYEQAQLPLTVTQNMYCAGESEGKADTCSGDSGGPMVFADDSGRERRWIIEGIVSWGSPTGCGYVNQFGGFTKVFNFLDWISEFI